jgi:hypothetical protein
MALATATLYTVITPKLDAIMTPGGRERNRAVTTDRKGELATGKLIINRYGIDYEAVRRRKDLKQSALKLNGPRPGAVENIVARCQLSFAL